MIDRRSFFLAFPLPQEAADDPRAAVHREGVERVIDLQLLQQHVPTLHRGTAKRTDEERHARVDGPNPGADCDKAGEDPVAHSGEVLLPRAEPEQEGRQAAGGRRDRRVHRHERPRGRGSHVPEA